MDRLVRAILVLAAGMAVLGLLIPIGVLAAIILAVVKNV